MFVLGEVPARPLSKAKAIEKSVWVVDGGGTEGEQDKEQSDKEVTDVIVLEWTAL